MGIHTATLWVFSTENWDRSKEEIEVIMQLIEQLIDRRLKESKREGVQIIHLGRKDRIPATLLQKVIRAEEETKNNKNYVLNVALDYGGKDEIIRATKRMLQDGVNPDNMDEKLFSSYLDTTGQPYPYVDLLIRTSGEQRLSGFMPWQMNYAEFWWDDTPLPAFDEEKLHEALLDFSRRRRRFGGNDAVKKFTFAPRVVAKFELDWWRMRRFSDRGGFTKAFAHYVKEQFGISAYLAKNGAELFVKAAFGQVNSQRSQKLLTEFYKFIRDNVRLAFEPKFVASLELEYLQKSNGEKKLIELQEVASKLFAEIFRIPLLQANKVARLRLLAHDQEELASEATGKKKQQLLDKAKQYLIESYEALKERVA